MKKILVLLVLMATSTVRVAYADDFSGFSVLQKVDDTSLATMRGKYVPPGGTVTYLGVQMITSWSVQGKSGPQGVQVGATVGIDANTQTITISDWSSSQNGGLPKLQTNGNSVVGAPPVNNVSGGVGQSIQVAGDDNDVSNASTLTISFNRTPAVTILPTTTTCGSICSTTIGADSIGIAIQTEAGVAAQQIGAGGITQTVQLAGDGNAIANTMQLHAQVQNFNGFNAAALLPVLHTIDFLK